MQAGLGGGSSDAATTLLGLNALWQLGLSVDELAEFGLALGADVPVFVRGQSAWAEGVGERLTPIDLPSGHYVVIDPHCNVSTPEIFCDPSLVRDTPKVRIADYYQGFGHNDLETVAKKHYPEIEKAINWLSVFSDARMSGSGSTVFGTFDNFEKAAKVAAQIPPQWTARVVSGLGESPVKQQLCAAGLDL